MAYLLGKNLSTFCFIHRDKLPLMPKLFVDISSNHVSIVFEIIGFTKRHVLPDLPWFTKRILRYQGELDLVFVSKSLVDGLVEILVGNMSDISVLQCVSKMWACASKDNDRRAADDFR